MGDRPTLDYQKPVDQYWERAGVPPSPPLPRLRRRWVLLCWLPPVIAILTAFALAGIYGSAERMPKRVWAATEFLLLAAFWWTVAAVMTRVARWARVRR